MFFHFDKMGVQKTDKEGAIELVKLNGQFLDKLLPRYKKDHDVVLTAIKEQPSAFVYADFQLKYDKIFAKKAIQTNGFVFQYLPESLREDPKLTYLTVTIEEAQFFTMLEYASPKVKNNPKFLLKLAKADEMCLLKADPKVYTEKLILELLQVNPRVLTSIPDKWYKNYNVCEQALKLDGDLFGYVHNNLKTNDHLIYLALKNSKSRDEVWAKVKHFKPIFALEFENEEAFLKIYESHLEKVQINQEISINKKAQKLKIL